MKFAFVNCIRLCLFDIDNTKKIKINTQARTNHIINGGNSFTVFFSFTWWTFHIKQKTPIGHILSALLIYNM